MTKLTRQVQWPDIPRSSDRLGGANPVQMITRIIGFLDRLRRVLQQRDERVVRAINALDIEVVDAEPSEAPDQGEPALRLYSNGGNYRLYVYVDDGWHYVVLT